MSWELVEKSDEAKFCRFKVDGGYIYSLNAQHKEMNQMNTAICFVPDVDLQRYQAHLRDAYNQGYKAGYNDSKNGFDLPKEVELSV